MALPDKLFELIHSLSKSEKRYFKLYANFHKGNKNYLKLFDAVDAQQDYQEQEIKELFKKEKFAKQFPVTKNYLYNLIMKSLSAFYTNKFADSQLKELIHHAEILNRKELYEHTAVILKKAKKIAYMHEKFIHLLDIIALEKRKEPLANFTSKEKIVKLAKEESDVLAKYNNHLEYWNLFAHTSHLTAKSGLPRTEAERKKYKAIIEHPLMHREERALSHLAKDRYYYLLGNYHHLIGDIEKSNEYSKKRLLLSESFPEKIKENPKLYIGLTNNYLFTCLAINAYHEFEITLKKIKDFPSIHPTILTEGISVKLFECIYTSECSYIVQTGKTNITILIKQIEDGLNKFKGKLNKIPEMEITFFAGYILFMNGNYKEALKWFFKIYNSHVAARPDMQNAARIITLFCYYELGNIENIEYLLTSVFRMLEKQRKLFLFEKMILNFVKSISKTNDESEKTALFKQLKQELIKISDVPDEKNFLILFDVISWLESKIENKAFAEIVKEKAQEAIPSET